MRCLVFLFAAVMFLSGMALAQDPANFHIIYGNRDGSPVTARIGDQIHINIWVATDPTPGNIDTVTWMFDPLDANCSIISSRDGGWGHRWHCDSFPPPIGCMQAHKGSGCRLYTRGDTVQIGYFVMTLTNDPSYIGQTVPAFSMGIDPVRGGISWGLPGDNRSVVPTQTYCRLQIVPNNFYLIYGNKDGSPMNVQLGQEIEIPVWGATEANPDTTDDIPDTISFMFLLLASNDSFITERNRGFFPDTLVGHWDDASFLAVKVFPSMPGFHTQSMLAYQWIDWGPDPWDYLITFGDTVLICTFKVRVTSDPAYIGQTVYPFKKGLDDVNGDLAWGFMGGAYAVAPIQTYGGIHFSSCDLVLGDMNNDGHFTGLDITYGVYHFRHSGPYPIGTCDCPPYGQLSVAGDMNGDCNFTGLDIVYGIAYLKGIGPFPRLCTACW